MAGAAGRAVVAMSSPSAGASMGTSVGASKLTSNKQPLNNTKLSVLRDKKSSSLNTLPEAMSSNGMK
jgi:hypothetical protein